MKLRTSFTRWDCGISFMGNEDVAGSSEVGLLDENGLPVFPTTQRIGLERTLYIQLNVK
jgi:hypothetical protein